MIPEHIVQKIKDAANIIDVIEEFQEIKLYRKGKDFEALCPFHDDHALGNFVISPKKNIYKCFSCQAQGGPVDFLMNYAHMKYHEALRWLAKLYDIDIPDDGKKHDIVLPKVTKRPNTPPPELPVITFDKHMTIQRRWKPDDGNVWVGWFRSLPWPFPDYSEKMLELYNVGTSLKGKTEGWTIWWYMDPELRLRTGKMMKYKPDGHRDKAVNPLWVHTSLERAGKWSSDKNRVEICLFGLHLVDCFPDAEICIVESEKTAVICQALANCKDKLFMACGGLQRLNRRLLQPLIDRKRWVVLYADIDGEEKWKEKAKEINYERLDVSSRIYDHYDRDLDGDKADIADVLVRKMLRTNVQSIQDKVHKMLGLTETHNPLNLLIEKLQLLPE